MAKVNCLECKNRKDPIDCQYQFRWASNAGGRGVDCREDVWFCTDYEEEVIENDGNDEYDGT